VEHLSNDIESLVAKYLTGEATPDERRFVESWIASDNANLKYFQDLKEIFTRASAVANVQPFDADAAWEKMRGRLSGKSVPMQPATTGFSFLKIAAAILVLVTASFLIFRYLSNPPVQTLEMAATETTKADTLPDGTGVFLNKASRIAYEYNPKQKQHKVKLKGEAYFEIRHSQEKDFIVDAQEVFIKDIGTVFNVKAYPDSAFIEVMVEEGEVRFYTSTDEGITVSAKEKGRYDKKTKTFSLAKPEANETAYRTKIFAFADMELAEVVESLNQVYDSQIEINEAVSRCRVSVSFNNEQIKEIAEVLAETLDLKITQTGRVIRLEGRGCAQ
jgi:transmembrane sensor